MSDVAYGEDGPPRHNGPEGRVARCHDSAVSGVAHTVAFTFRRRRKLFSRMLVEELGIFARRTLSRDINDQRPVPVPYLAALDEFTKKHPMELNFLMRLEEEGGTLTCMDCWEDIPCGAPVDPQNQVFQFSGLAPLERHIMLPSHRGSASDRYNNFAQAQQIMQSPGIEIDMRRPANPIPPMGRGTSYGSRKRAFAFPDGEIIEISDDEEDIAVPGILGQQQPQMQQSPSWASNIAPQRFQSATVAPTSSRQGRYSPMDIDNMVAPFSSGAAGPSSIGLGHQPIPETLVGPHPAVPVAFNSTGRAIDLTTPYQPVPPPPTSDNRPNVKRKRYVLDDFVIELTDDEGEISNPSTSSSSQPLEQVQAQKRVKHELRGSPSGSLTYTPIPAMQLRPMALVPPSDPGSYGPHFETQIPGAWPSHDPVPGPSDSGGSSNLAAVGSFPGTGLQVLASAAALYSQSGFKLNYDDQSPVRRIDIGGGAHAEKVKDFIAQAAQDDDERLESVDGAAELLGLDSRNDYMPGLNILLRPHQLIGVAWMAKQESESIHGGILADDMGLGKTVQAIALMIKCPPNDRKYRGTLIVAPAALLQQWKQEIEDKTQEGLFRIHIHHGSDKLRTSKEVSEYDIIITTYQTLCGDFPRRRKRTGAANGGGAAEDDEFDDDPDIPNGPLGKTSWHRIILDEAQQIRNRNTRSSICMALMTAKHRWCLTGTPVTNTLVDLYGFTRFLRFEPWNDWKSFDAQIGKVQKRNVELAGRRAQVILKRTLLRRSKTSRVEGSLVTDLPPKHVEMVQVEFSNAEREIYAAVESKARLKVNKFLKAGTLMKNYAFVLVMILRLRQACNHPKLLAYRQGESREDGLGVVSNDESGGIGDSQTGNNRDSVLQRATQDLGPQFVLELQTRFRQKTLDRMKAEVTGCDLEEEDGDCPICFDPFDSVTCVVTGCKHLFCEECIHDVLKSPMRRDDAANHMDDQMALADSRPCPVCRQAIDRSHLYRASAFEPTEAEMETLQKRIQGSPRLGADEEDDAALESPALSKKEGKAKTEPEPCDLSLKDLAIDEKVEPSTKMLKMLDYIKDWLAQYPDDKIILYSQWTSMIDLVTQLLSQEDIDVLRFDGKMSRLSRDETLRQFKRADGPRILIISLKCGGVGLNLVNANRCICLDLAWNNATEQQAIDRCYRMGQHKEVTVKRIVVRDTIEDRILKLQLAKQGLADAALGEGGAQKNGKMTINDIKMIFNL